MNLMSRAFLYIRRKRSKTLILFLVLLVLATFVLSGVSVKRASETAELNIRQALGGKFGISIDKTKSDHFQPIKEGESGVQYIGKPIDNSVINKIMETDGIDKYNAYYSGQALLKSKTMEYLKLIQTNDRYKDDVKMQHTIGNEANTESKHSSYFENGALELTQGSHIKSTDKNVALISKELAALNGLKIGDTLTIESTENKQSVNLKIIGIFTILEPQRGIEAAPPASLHYNRIFTDIDSAGKIYNSKDGNYNKVDFYVNDPAQMDAI